MQKTSFDPSHSLLFLTNRVGRLLSNGIRQRAREENIDLLPTHLGVLVDLWVEDGLRQQDLAMAMIKDKGTIARAIDALEKMNMVVRAPDQKDKRNKRIYLTHKGKSLKERLYPHAQQTLCRAAEGISEQDLHTCKEVLRKMYFRLNSR